MDSSMGTILIHSASISETTKIGGPGYGPKYCGCFWVMLSSETMWKFMIHAAAGDKRQGEIFCNGIDGCRLTVENERHRKPL